MNAPIEMMIKHGYEKITTFQDEAPGIFTKISTNTMNSIMWKSLMDQAKQFLPLEIRPFLKFDGKLANAQITPPLFLSECEAFRIVCDGINPIKVTFIDGGEIMFSVFRDEKMQGVQYQTYDLDVALAYAHRLAADQAFRSISHKIV